MQVGERVVETFECLFLGLRNADYKSPTASGSDSQWLPNTAALPPTPPSVSTPRPPYPQLLLSSLSSPCLIPSGLPPATAQPAHYPKRSLRLH